jgi:hypothetical protein
VDNERHNFPDVVHVELSHHFNEWSTPALPAQLYKFRCLGRPWGPTRWVVHAIWANRPEPDMRSCAMSVLRELISSALSEQLGREISDWSRSLLAWKDDE